MPPGWSVEPAHPISRRTKPHVCSAAPRRVGSLVTVTGRAADAVAPHPGERRQMNFGHRFEGASVEQLLGIWGDRAFYEDLAADLKIDRSQVEVQPGDPAPTVRQQLAF